MQLRGVGMINCLRYKTGFLTCIFAAFLLFLPFKTYGDNSILIGATISEEGQYEKLSFMVYNGYKVWVQEVNARGGLLGRPVKLITYNDKSQKKLVAPLYEKLILEDKVDLLLSPYGSTLTLEAAKVADKHNYVMLAATASSLEIWKQGFRNIFGVYSTADRYFIGFLDLIARQQIDNVGIIYHNSSFNISAATGSSRWAELFGIEVAFYEMYNEPEKQLSSLVKQLKEKKVESLIFCGYPDDGYLFLQLLKVNRFKPRAVALTITPALDDFYTLIGPFAENIFGPSQWEADERLPFPGVAKFIIDFSTLTGGIMPSYQACSAYSACTILEKAVHSVGVLEQSEIRRYIHNLDTVTIMGRFKVDIAGRQIGHNSIIIQWQDQKKEIVYPTEMGTKPPYIPPTGWPENER